MSQSRIGKWGRRLVWGTLAVVMTIGCNPLSTFAFLNPKDTKKPAQYPLTFKDGPKKNKDEVVVAIFVSSAPGAGALFAGCEGKLASELAKRLSDLAKEAKQKLVVIESRDVNKFKISNSKWKVMHPSAWGKALRADFVIEVRLDKMFIYKEGSNNMLYDGQAEVTVDVYDVDLGPTGEPKWNYVLPFNYPHTMMAADSVPINRFKQDFLEHLAAELALKHVDSKQGSGIAEEPR